MNRKLRLDLDQLTVDSFAVSARLEGAGTVRAQGEVPPQEPVSDYDGVCNTYQASCNGSCASCVNTCWNTCGNTCASCNFTCQLSCHSVCYEPATAEADGCY
ncbi:hypothetical protein [Longimicrobium sp.]|uniref:hypothetical protein n=1 Tax=Longimicrobium sp. TaxID=2029185 RepID=UPI002CDAB904|nr:hypothetical protein [Longimicrobium sp.]HSU12545.1 hypothetical protein [Longimicrobium sp.]